MLKPAGRRALVSLVFLVLVLACARPPAETQVYFSPKGGVEKALVRLVDEASRQADIAMYAFTSERLAEALVQAHRRGVRVRVLLDPNFAEESGFSQHEFLAANGVEVRSDPVHAERAGLMHNKFLVVDGRVVATGSYNWTASADTTNDENIIVLRNQPVVQQAFGRRFELLWQRGTPPGEAPSAGLVRILATDLAGLKRNANRQAVVVGKVKSVGRSKRSDTYFLDFGPTRDAFTAVIFRNSAALFRARGVDIEEFEGKYVELTGRIKDDPKYGLEMIIDSPDQVRVERARR